MCEVFHVIGLGLLVFKIIAELDVVKAVMLTNSMCLVPAVLSIMIKVDLNSYVKSNYYFKIDLLGNSTRRNSKTQLWNHLLDLLAVCAQCTGLIVWPLLSSDSWLWLIPVAVTLTSFRWWENYVSANSWFAPIRRLSEMKERLSESRYHIYLFVVPLKIFMFLCTGIFMSDIEPLWFFTRFTEGWQDHDIKIVEVTLLT